MHHRTIHAVEDLFENMLSRQNRADRYMAARKRLGDEHHIRLDVPVFDRKKTAGASQSGLNLIGNEQGAVAAAKLRDALEVIVRRYIDAFALDRFDDEGRNVARAQCFFERGKIVEGDADAVGQQRLEASPENFVAVERQRAVRKTVEGMIAIDDARAAGRTTGKFDRSFHRL